MSKLCSLINAPHFSESFLKDNQDFLKDYLGVNFSNREISEIENDMLKFVMTKVSEEKVKSDPPATAGGSVAYYCCSMSLKIKNGKLEVVDNKNMRAKVKNYLDEGFFSKEKNNIFEFENLILEYYKTNCLDNLAKIIMK